MTPFTTSKGDFIAVPVPEKAYDFTNDMVSHQIDYNEDHKMNNNKTLTISSSIILRYNWGEQFEIIGLSSDILKDEELARKIISLETIGHVDAFKNYLSMAGWFHQATRSVETLFTLNSITDNQLIIKKK